jgi:hypothetical protein
MALLVPPKPPVQIALGDDDRLRRLHFRLWQILLTITTILATVWVMLLGMPILSIIAVAIAKHVLVAVYMMGLHAYPVQE